MIKETNTSILRELPDFSVILHQCNCQGFANAGIAMQICKHFPGWFTDYHGYCSWFRDGHEDQILGTFHRFEVNPKLIICSAFAQIGITKSKQVTDYKAWEKICRKIERQTRYINEHMHMNWTIHAQRNIGSNFDGADPAVMEDIFNFYFKDSPVELWLHDTRM